MNLRQAVGTPDGGRGFTASEIGRVGRAATMMIVGGFAIVMGMTVALGHYNSLVHSGPKAVLDGVVIGLLMGQRCRWRCLALLGTVYGLAIVVQVGVPYLALVLAIAAVVAAAMGRGINFFSRPLAVLVAAACYEWLAGFGAPIKIYFATGDGREPIPWFAWLAEWPLRLAGAPLGVCLAWRWTARRHTDPNESSENGLDVTKISSEHLSHRSTPTRVPGMAAASLRLSASILACIVPMILQGWWWIGTIALTYLLYALWVRLDWRLLFGAVGTLFFGWTIYAGASYLWHQDPQRIIELIRTFILRWAPVTLASLVLVSQVRAVDLLRVLRALHLSPVVLIPFANVLRSLPEASRDVHLGVQLLRQRSTDIDRPVSLTILRHPRYSISVLLSRPLRRWAQQLHEDS